MADHHHSPASEGDYHKGEMDIHMQQSSFELFVTLTKWGSLAITAVLTFFIILFCVKDAGFFGAIFAFAVVAGFGFLLLKKGADSAH
jgi:hypothetical protein